MALLINQTGIPTRYRFGGIRGNQADYLDVQMDPSDGVLMPKEEKFIGVNTVIEHLNCTTYVAMTLLRL